MAKKLKIKSPSLYNRISNLEDLKRNIEGINRRLQEIIKEDLEKIAFSSEKIKEFSKPCFGTINI